MSCHQKGFYLILIAILAALGETVFGQGFGIEMMEIPEESFLMGDPWSEGDADEQPVHPVTISPNYWIGKYEITNAEYAAALTWALQNAGSLPPEEQITNSTGGPYTGGPAYVNGKEIIEIGDFFSKFFAIFSAPTRRRLVRTARRAPQRASARSRARTPTGCPRWARRWSYTRCGLCQP